MARAVALAVVVQLAMCPTALATIRFGAAVAHDAGLKRNVNTPVIPGTLDVAVGDVNRDGIPDIVAAGDRGDVSVLLGKGGGRFGPPLLHHGRGNKESVGIADLNNDGSPDLVITNYRHDGVGVM